MQDLRLGLQGWCRAARRGVAAHEAEAIDAERRFRLRQLAAKEAELAATRCRMEALEGEKEHLVRGGGVYDAPSKILCVSS